MIARGYEEVNWLQAEIVTDADIYFGVRFMIYGESAHVWMGRERVEWVSVASFEHVEGIEYKLVTGTGVEWTVLKKRCNCPPGKL